MILERRAEGISGGVPKCKAALGRDGSRGGQGNGWEHTGVAGQLPSGGGRGLLARVAVPDQLCEGSDASLN